MPSKSKAQHNLMAAACHSDDFADKVKIDQETACEYVEADKHDKSYKKHDKISKEDEVVAATGPQFSDIYAAFSDWTSNGRSTTHPPQRPIEDKIKRLEERHGAPIDSIVARGLGVEEKDVGEAIGRIREMADENDIPEDRTQKIIKAEIASMESFLDRTQQAGTDYPRDHLLMTYSNEGFKELFYKVRKALTNKDEYGVKPQDRKPGAKVNDNPRWTPEGKAAVDELNKALDKYYLNDHWLNGQIFVEGDVKASDFSKAFEMDGKVSDPFAAIKASVEKIKQYENRWLPMVAKVEAEVRRLDKQLANETNGAALDDQTAIDKVKVVIKEFEKLSHMAIDAPKFPGTTIGNHTLVVEKGRAGWEILKVVVAKEPKGVDTLPALDKEGIKQAAQLIKKCYSYKDPLVEEHPILDKLRWLDHSDGSKFNKWIYDADNDVYMDYYTIFYYQGPDSDWAYPPSYLIDDHQLASALERWIDRSIK